MKKYIYILLASLLTLTSCNTFLVETSATKYPMDKYFNDEEEVMLYLYGTYYQVKNAVFGTDFMYLTDTMTDDVDYTSTNVARKGVAYLTLNSTNSLVKSVWGKMYAVIEQCNILIDQMERNPELSAANTNTIIAECSFMRAWAYFHLVQLWGDVPLVTKPVYDIDSDNIVPCRTAKDEVLSFLVTDLEWSAQQLGDTPTSVTGINGITYKFSIPKSAVKLLLGKVYQLMGQEEDVISTLSYFMDGTDPDPRWGLCEHYNYIFDTKYKTEAGRSKEILWEMVASAETNLNNTWHREVAPSELKGPNGEVIFGKTNGYQSYIPTYNLIKNSSSTDLRYLEGYQFS
ncbi:MAG: RagB/SusD family nutrient uptake outer membrane protein, partial [Candidatus Cryptobacteroides sp.]